VEITAVENYEQKEILRLPVSELKQYMLRTVMFIFPVQVSPVGWSIIPYLLEWGLGCEGAMCEKFVSKAVDENGDGLDV
jgi:hypothetical protein